MTGILERAGAETTPITDRAAAKGAYRGTGARKTARDTWGWPGATNTVNWLSEMGLIQYPQLEGETEKARSRPFQKLAEQAPV